MLHEFETLIGSAGAQPAPSRLARIDAPRRGPCEMVRRADSARLGIRCHGRAMQPAALRVLETTWRVWREPLA